jgi:hypothetical protein
LNHDGGRGSYDGPLVSGDGCVFHAYNTYVVLWDGRITTCCLEHRCMTPYTVDDILESGYCCTSTDRCLTCNVGPKLWETKPICMVDKLHNNVDKT